MHTFLEIVGWSLAGIGALFVCGLAYVLYMIATAGTDNFWR